jgi:chromosome segregation ATPase
VAQQLVSKIRQYQKERERAELAESRLAKTQDDLKLLREQHVELERKLAITEDGFAGYKGIIEHLCRDLAHEQAEKADYIQKLHMQTARLDIEQMFVASLRAELATVEQGFADYTVLGEKFLRDLASTQGKLAEQIAEAARKEAEWIAEKQRLIASYDEQLRVAAEQLAHQKRETETVSQQLVSKIRQLKTERARAETAEASLAERDEQLAVMTSQYEEKCSLLERTEAELATTKQRLARMMLALDEERRTTSELRVTNRSSEERAERAEKLCRELADTITSLEQVTHLPGWLAACLLALSK